MTTIKDITDTIEQFAPLSAQEGFDNSGLLVGDNTAPVNSVLLCVDITERVMDEAGELGVQMVISHHPVIFHGLKRLVSATYVERVVERAIKGGIALYACHTNLDAVPGGLSYRLADMLGLQKVELLTQSKDYDPTIGFGVVGELAAPMQPMDFLREVKRRLKPEVIRYSEVNRPEIRRVAICSGSGAGQIADAKRAGADIYIAADFKYNDFLDADRDIIVVDVGHFESECCAIDALYDIITKKMSTFAVHKSVNSRNPVNYLY